jgi:hypothetical protein
VPKRKYVFTDSSNEQYPCLKDNGSGSGHLRVGMFAEPCIVKLKLGEGGDKN